MEGDALRQCLVQFKPGTAHMPVRGDQTHRAIAALFDPMGRFDGVGTGVDCLVSQSDAAIEQFFRRVIGYGQFPRPHIAVYARYQHRSEEHTSELQSLMRISYAFFCLKKKKNLTPHQFKSKYYTTALDSHI